MKIAEAAVEKELLLLLQHAQRRRIGLPGGEVMAGAFGCREIGGLARAGLDVFPGERRGSGLRRGRVPLGEPPLREFHFDRDLGPARRVKVDHGRLHADRAERPRFDEMRRANDKARQVLGAGERRPVNGIALGVRDRRERAPLVGDHSAGTARNGFRAEKRRREEQNGNQLVNRHLPLRGARRRRAGDR